MKTHQSAEVGTIPRLDMRGKTITTYIVFAAHEQLAAMPGGEKLELLTDTFPAIETDLRAWSRATGNELVQVATEGDTGRYVIRKGPPQKSGQKLAAIISDDGLFELLSPLGFALAAALEGHDVSLYFQGPAVRVLGRGFVARMHGPGRPFSRFPREGLAEIGHIPPQEKLRQLQKLGATLYACGPSMDHYKVKTDDLAFEGVIVAEYLTFMEQMAEADMEMFV